MEHIADPPPLTSVQQCVIDALAAGSSITAAAEDYGVQRMTVCRWIKNRPEFSAALHSARADFVLARRDDLHHLSNRSLETLLTILDNPRASPAVHLRTAMFILQRPQLPKTGWSMPEPAAHPEGEDLADSATIEQDYDSVPGFQDAAQQSDYDETGETPAEAELPAEAAAPEPPSTAADVTECDEMLHDSPIRNDAARHGLRSCPVPPAVLDARRKHTNFLECLDLIDSIENELPPGYSGAAPSAAPGEPHSPRSGLKPRAG